MPERWLIRSLGVLSGHSRAGSPDAGLRRLLVVSLRVVSAAPSSEGYDAEATTATWP